MRWWKGSRIPQVLAPRILSCLSGGSLLMMQLVFCFSSMISWLLLALPLPAYYLGGWKGLEGVGGAEWRGRAMEDSRVPTSLRSAGGNKCGTRPMPGMSCLLCVYPVWVLCGEWRARAMEDICCAQQSQVWNGGNKCGTELMPSSWSCPLCV
jgi:hypothetical protein